jgi:hypothetical protein
MAALWKQKNGHMADTKSLLWPDPCVTKLLASTHLQVFFMSPRQLQVLHSRTILLESRTSFSSACVPDPAIIMLLPVLNTPPPPLPSLLAPGCGTFPDMLKHPFSNMWEWDSTHGKVHYCLNNMDHRINATEPCLCTCATQLWMKEWKPSAVKTTGPFRLP